MNAQSGSRASVSDPYRLTRARLNRRPRPWPLDRSALGARASGRQWEHAVARLGRRPPHPWPGPPHGRRRPRPRRRRGDRAAGCPASRRPGDGGAERQDRASRRPTSRSAHRDRPRRLGASTLDRRTPAGGSRPEPARERPYLQLRSHDAQLVVGPRDLADRQPADVTDPVHDVGRLGQRLEPAATSRGARRARSGDPERPHRDSASDEVQLDLAVRPRNPHELGRSPARERRSAAGARSTGAGRSRRARRTSGAKRGGQAA